MPRKENPIICPQLRQLESWPLRRNSTYPATSGEMWEISSPAKNSLSWSIVLAYVICMKENLQQQFQLLLGNNEMKDSKIRDLEAIRKQVMRFNPFKNRHSFYSNANKTIKRIRKSFDLSLNRFANKMKKDVAWGNTLKLEAASRMLKCQIRVYETDQEGIKTFHSFPEEQDVPCGNGEIVIFQHSGVAITENINDKFAFGMSVDHALSLRKDALLYILKTAKLDNKNIDSIVKDFHCGKNFLYFLLRTRKHDVIPILYKSPYIPLKLAEAGFNTDPFCLEQPDGPSVFHYSVHPDAYEALITLYDYASNNCYRTSETTRNPDTDILSALESVSNLIRKDSSISNDGITIWRGISRFSEYQCNIVKSILELKNSEQNAELKSEMIVCCIFRHFNKHFHFEGQQFEDNLVSYANFIQYSCYYENLDSFTCLLFFDMFLKVNNSDLLIETGMSLFLTILSYKYLPKCIHTIRNTPCDLSERYCGLRFVPFNNRCNFLKNARDLLSSLETTSVKSTVEPKETIQNLRHKLGSLPELKDQFSITRLKVNMKSALDVPLETSGIRGVLTIERALQVLGETLCPPRGGECVLSCLLSSCIPQNITNNLISIRNILSHSKPAFVLGRLHVEQSSFKDLQESLNHLNHIFEFVYDTQEFRMILLLLEGSNPEAHNFSNDILEKLENWQDSTTEKKNRLYQTHQERYVLLIDGVLNFFSENIKRDDYKKTGKYGEIAALEFLYNSLPPTLAERNQILRETKAMKVPKENVKLSKEDKDNLIDLLSKQRKIIMDAFGHTNPPPSEDSDFNNLQSFYERVKSYSPFCDKEIENIKTIVKGILERSSEAKGTLRTSLENNCLTSSQLRNLLSAIVMPDKQRENIASNFPKDSQKALTILNKVKEENMQVILESSPGDFLVFLKKEELRWPMNSTTFPDSLENNLARHLNCKVIFLLNRIDHLKKILIEEDYEISQLWKWGRSTAIQKYVRFLMRLRYTKQRDVRASLEMLLFDCHNILPEREDLKHLWTKVNKLFTGIDMRDVLSHGNTVLQMTGEILDPEDLPTELIDKMLGLIEDSEIVRTVLKLFEEVKPNNKQELDSAIEASSDIPDSIKKTIKCEKKWKDYFDLFPLL